MFGRLRPRLRRLVPGTLGRAPVRTAPIARPMVAGEQGHRALGASAGARAVPDPHTRPGREAAFQCLPRQVDEQNLRSGRKFAGNSRLQGRLQTPLWDDDRVSASVKVVP